MTIAGAYCERGVSERDECAIESVAAFIQRYAKLRDLLLEGGVVAP